MIAEFLLYLREHRKLKSGTIGGYQLAIACDLQDLAVGSELSLHRLIRSFQIKDLSTPSVFL